VTEANAANTGTGIVSPGSLVGAMTGDTYEIQFTSATTFDVVNVTAATTLSTGNTFVSGGAITFAGRQLDIAGAPASGDRFTVAPSASQDVFTTLSDFITALDTQGGSAVGNAQLANAVNTALSNLDHALDRVLTVRADIGARLAEIDSLDALGEGIALQYAKTASELRDLDYAQAISDLTRQQTVLEAAQKSFVATSSLSLFDLI
jgi:flagellar hook-associated protein 3 FlgL